MKLTWINWFGFAIQIICFPILVYLAYLLTFAIGNINKEMYEAAVLAILLVVGSEMTWHRKK